MPSSAVRYFTDPDDYAAAIQAATVEVTITKCGDFAAKQIRIDLDRLWMQRVSESLPRVVHAAIMPGRAGITFLAKPGPSLRVSGVEMQGDQIIRYSEGEDTHQLSSGAACLGAMSLPMEEMASLGATMAGCDLTPPRSTQIVTGPPAAMARLQRLHATAGHLAENAPDIIAHPDAARGLEQALVAALVDCLAKNDVREESVAQRQHELIMRRFHRVLEESPGQPHYIPEICKKIGVSDRTLRVCCQEHFGMGPKHYLLLRRLHLARRALRKATPETTTVTEVATRYGFWHFGLFAGGYRAAFGESPSATLQRPAD
jgi:AraC-like DNA-binding protein